MDTFWSGIIGAVVGGLFSLAGSASAAIYAERRRTATSEREVLEELYATLVREQGLRRAKSGENYANPSPEADLPIADAKGLAFKLSGDQYKVVADAVMAIEPTPTNTRVQTKGARRQADHAIAQIERYRYG